MHDLDVFFIFRLEAVIIPHYYPDSVLADRVFAYHLAGSSSEVKHGFADV